jgi:phosphate-selective porin OprO/OprP
VLGEYVISNQRVTKGAASANLQNTSWQVSAGWVLTGEDATYTGVTPRHAFNPREGYWGAFQLVGRYAELDIDNDAFPIYANPLTSATDAQAWSVGLNWYLNKNIRVNTSFSRTTFTGGGGAGTSAPAIISRQPEEVLFTRLQLAF